MEVKNGIIIDGVLHEMTSENVPCNQCSFAVSQKRKNIPSVFVL